MVEPVQHAGLESRLDFDPIVLVVAAAEAAAAAVVLTDERYATPFLQLGSALYVAP